ncbi:MAG TPA: hypothetical protein VD908_01310 [Cytophagales bacterium]|nr:hypothetical protein [Cytophagales bacterium]
MKRIYFFSLVVFTLFFINCSDDEAINGLIGTWVESVDKEDTIIFKEDALVLSRGKELRDGYLLPKDGSGIFEYKIKNDSITLINLALSCVCPRSYYFKKNGLTIKVGRFFYEIDPNEILTFERIR